jgi:hypothetical protein
MLRDIGLQNQYTSLLTYGCLNVRVSRARGHFHFVAVQRVVGRTTQAKIARLQLCMNVKRSVLP